MNKLLFKLTARLPCRLIKVNGPYLERYYLGQLFGVTFYLHRFVSSDRERHLHNHPWGWGRALVLAGRYDEEYVGTNTVLVSGTFFTSRAIITHRIRWWNKVNGDHFHRISNARPGTWTLFFHSPRVQVNGKLKGWGFLEKGKFTPYPYPLRETDEPRWWVNAKLGRDIGREAL